MPKSTVSGPSTLDERAADAARYQRAVELAFSYMESKKGAMLDCPDAPVVKDAFKHVALLPWMQHMLIALAADKPVFGLSLPYHESWSFAGAWDYEPDDALDHTRSVSSRLWLRAGSTFDLWVTQTAVLTVGADLRPKVVYTYTFHLKSKKDLQMDVTVCTMPHAKELVPMDGADINVAALAQILEGALRLVWLRQQEER